MTDKEMLEISIDRLGAKGDGLARWNGKPVYVDGALPGEIVRARVAGRRGDGVAAVIDDIVKASPDRRPAPCGHAATCGGCSLQHASEPLYRDWKMGLLNGALARRGLSETTIEPLKIAPPASRRRARLGIKRAGGRTLVGFRARHSHHLVAMDGCLVLTPALMAAIRGLRPVLSSLNADEIDLTETETGIDILLHGKAMPGLAALERMTAAAYDLDLARIGWRMNGADIPIAVRHAPELTFGDVPVLLPAGAFVQPTAWGEHEMAARIADCLVGTSHMADLYAGLGAFGLRSAANRRVTAIDSVATMTEAMVQAANRAGLADRLTVAKRDLAHAPLAVSELKPFDAVLFDPPRQGAPEQSTQIAASAVPLVIAASCHPGSFSRDARILVDGGYRLDTIWPIDQFLWSHHLELVAVFRRG